MKLLHTIQTLVEQEGQPFWVKQALNSWDYEDVHDTLKLFGGDLHEYYKALDSRGFGEDFLNQITLWEESPNYYITHALGGRDAYRRGLMDEDLLIKYVVDNIVKNEIRDLKKYETGKIYLTLDMYSKPDFFETDSYNRISCEETARLVFEDTLWENWYNDIDTWTPNVDELLGNLSQQNYKELISNILNNHQTLTCFREEFESWVEQDNIGEDTFYVDASRMNGFLNDSDRYNFEVLLGCADELEEYVSEMKHSYRSAYSDELLSLYYNRYHKDLEKLLGKPVGKDKTYDYRGKEKIELEADVYEVTDLVNKILIEAALSGEELQYSDFGEIYRDLNSGGGLCPGHFDDVYDDEKLWEQYNERFSEYL